MIELGIFLLRQRHIAVINLTEKIFNFYHMFEQVSNLAYNVKLLLRILQQS